MAAQKTLETSSIDKSLLTNVVAAACMLLGWFLPPPWREPVFNIGVFAFSGAITNWLAIYMLFEKVPGLYGSGVIPARFEDFKRGIHQLIMEQFFTSENFERFIDTATAPGAQQLDLRPLIAEIDMSPAFDALIAVVTASSFGSMLQMFGGSQALEPLRAPFQEKMQGAFHDIAHSPSFQQALHHQLSSASSSDQLLQHVDAIVQKRLEELTPQMVKEIIARMIHEHLGWLVVWGGVFGGAIGAVAALFQ